MSFVPDSPVEMPDGTLRCRRHGLEICGICCCDYTFMRDTLEEQEEAAKRVQESDEADGDQAWAAHEEGPVEMPDGTLRCQRHGLEICGVCCRDYTFMRDVLEEQEEEEATKRMQASDEADGDENWTPYEGEDPVEMPDGTLRCQRHGLEICGFCCCDYTFMRDILEEEKTKTKTTLCSVCSGKCQMRCSACKSVFCECDFLPSLVPVATEHCSLSRLWP